MNVVNALQIKNGAKVERRTLYGVTQPLQFINKNKKDEQWASWNMDWLEWQGMKHIADNSRRFLKAYKLANGILDKRDYIPEPDNDMTDLVNTLEHQNDKLESMELKFYPIIPNIINTLMGEFAKRDKKVSFRAEDEYTFNEIMENKRQDVENVLVKIAASKMMVKMIEQGLDPNDPQVQEQIQQNLTPDALRELPEIQDFYTKKYQVISEKWASRQHQIDEDRFNLEELEEQAFKDKLVTNREFWHFKMYEDDYDIEVWDPCLTFFQKSPNERYISNGQYVGHIDVMTAADIIDNYGWKMTDKQLEQLKESYASEMPGYSIAGIGNDGAMYDATRSHEWNVTGPSLGMRQYLSGMNNIFAESDIVKTIVEQGEDIVTPDNRHLFRVTTAYWKSQMKVGYLTKITEWGEVISDIVTEDYVVTDKPIYNNDLFKDKRRENLVFGEHIEWIWINQVWGGVKIGPNIPTFFNEDNTEGVKPIYIGINQNKIRPLKFQFKGESTLFGCKLPVEGRVFNDRNTKSLSLVDKLKPYQIGFNIVNNQISEILADELGTVILMDQNMLPKHSLGEDWGKGNFAKAYVAMKDFSILPVDTTITNTENATNFQHFQTLDMSQTQRLMSRIQMAQYFKQQAFELVGVSPQRMGTPVGQKTSATEAEQIQVSSFSQTEMIFIEHSDHLMPRVHQMRTDLAQWYAVNKPSIQIQMTTSLDERVNFEINRDDLLLRDIHVYCTTKANYRKILEQMKKLAIQNNTTGASIYDLGKLLQADSIGSLNSVLKESEYKQEKQMESQRQYEQQMEEQRIQAEMQEKQMEYNFKAQENEKDRRKDLLVAQIRAAGYGAMQDINQNQQSDFVDVLNDIRNTDLYEEEVNLKKSKQQHNQYLDQQKLDIKKEELALKRETNATNMAIARENKNRYDFPNAKAPKKEQNKKK